MRHPPHVRAAPVGGVTSSAVPGGARLSSLVLAVIAVARVAAADPTPPEIHGFVSEGAFVSTDNDYIGNSSRGSLELFEAGLNVSTEVADRLRFGLQVFGRDEGTLKDLPPRLDWAFLDYRWKRWLGLRAGITKMPFGLYNEYQDIDSARLPILLPQGVYSLRNRSALLAQTGFLLYGNQPLGEGGELDYQAWLGTLNVPQNALELGGASLDSIDTKYVTGAQLWWHPPVDGLKVGGTYLRTSIDFHLTLDPANIQLLEMLGIEPPTFDGKVLVAQRPVTGWVASAEYQHEDWLFAAEYSRFSTRQVTSIPVVLPTTEDTSERFYGLVAYRLSPCFETGGYYSVTYANVDDRHGHDKKRFGDPWDAWQRDAATTLRFDVNSHWLWKLEAHFIDGAADIDLTVDPHPVRYWGLLLLRTTVTF